MRRVMTRQELYDLVWSEPVSKLGPQYGVSGVAFAKACKRAGIPIPERGYWAKLRYGKSVDRTPLPPRRPGSSDTVSVPGKIETATTEDYLDDLEPPTFPDDIPDLRATWLQKVGRVRITPIDVDPHPLVAALLTEDEARRERQRTTRWYLSAPPDPLFDSAFERRRLRVLNALLVALDRIEVKTDFRDALGNGGSWGQKNSLGQTFAAQVGGWVPFRLAQREEKRKGRQSPKPTLKGSRLELTIGSEPLEGAKTSWNEDERPLERQLAEIAAEIVVAGELLHREWLRSNYEWLVKWKADREREEQRKKDAAERIAREKRLAEEKARIDRLRAEAEAFRHAADIRSYVMAARTANDGLDSVDDCPFEQWAAWAVAEADRIDPVVSRRFLAGIAALAPGFQDRSES